MHSAEACPSGTKEADPKKGWRWIWSGVMWENIFHIGLGGHTHTKKIYMKSRVIVYTHTHRDTTILFIYVIMMASSCRHPSFESLYVSIPPPLANEDESVLIICKSNPFTKNGALFGNSNLNQLAPIFGIPFFSKKKFVEKLTLWYLYLFKKWSEAVDPPLPIETIQLSTISISKIDY